MSNVTLPNAGVSLTLGGEKVSREFYRWMHDVTERIGGVTGSGTEELALSQFEDAGVEETKAALYSVADELRQVPPVSIQQEEAASPDVAALQAEVDLLRARLDALEQGQSL